MYLPTTLAMCHKVIRSQAARIRELEHDLNIYGDDAGLWYQTEWEREEETPMNSISLAFEANELRKEREKKEMVDTMWFGYYIPYWRFWAGYRDDEMDFDVPLNTIEKLLQKEFI